MQWGRHEGLDGRYGKHVEPLPQWGNRDSRTSTQPSSSSVGKCSEYPVKFHRNRCFTRQFLPVHDLADVPDQRDSNQFRRNTVNIGEKILGEYYDTPSALGDRRCRAFNELLASNREVEWIWLAALKSSQTNSEETGMKARLSKTASAEDNISAFPVPTECSSTAAIGLRGPERPWVLDRRTVAVSLALLSGLWSGGAAILVYLLT